MGKKLYVANLNYKTKESDLDGLFSKYGKISSVAILKDKETRRPTGVGFVNMEREEDAEKALAVNGLEFMGRHIKVLFAREKNR